MYNMDSFLNTFKSESTKRQYKHVIEKIQIDIGKNIEDTDNIVLKDYIQALKMSTKSIQDRHFVVQSYLKYHNKTYVEFDKNPIPKLKSTLPKKVDLIVLYDKVVFTESEVLDKLLLSLLLKHPQVLRNDLVDVLLKEDLEFPDMPFVDIIKHKIVFRKIHKTFQKIELTLTIDEAEIINSIINKVPFKHKYLFYNIKAADRPNAYGKYVNRITEKHLNIKLSQTDLRGIAATHDTDENEIDQVFIDKLRKITLGAKNRGHSLQTSLDKYARIK